jgi:hypothetical protein
MNILISLCFCLISTGVFKMPPKRLLSHYKIDARMNRLLTASCNAEDMLLPRSSFTFSGKRITTYIMDALLSFSTCIFLFYLFFFSKGVCRTVALLFGCDLIIILGSYD